MLEDSEKVAKMAMDMVDAAIKDIDKMWPKIGPGYHRPTDQERLQWAQQASGLPTPEMPHARPPMPIVRPDQTEVYASPYLVAASEAKGGTQELKRVQELTQPEVQ